MADEPQELELRGRGLASSLASARPGQVLMTDASGDVVGWRSRPMVGSFLKLLAVLGTVCFLGGWLLAQLVGPPGFWIAWALTMVGLSWWRRRISPFGEALTRLAADDLPGAERLARVAVTSRASVLTHGNALQVLGAVRWLRGDLHEALALNRQSIAALAQSRDAAAVPLVTLGRLHEAQLLALTGELDEARTAFARLEAEADLSKGDLLRLQTIDTRLVLAFEADDPSTLPDDLTEWTRRVVDTHRFGSTLVLLAWVHTHRDERDLAEALLDVATARLPECHLEVAHPRLHRWLEASRAPTPALARC